MVGKTSKISDTTNVYSFYFNSYFNRGLYIYVTDNKENMNEEEKLKFEAWARGFKNWTAFIKNKPDEAHAVKKEVLNILDGQLELF